MTPAMKRACSVEAATRSVLVSAFRFACGAALLGGVLCASAGPAIAQERTPIQPPQPTVPEIFTIEGQFVRVAYNNEGYVTLGYRAANYSMGQEWMLLEVGVTIRKGVKSQTLTREAFSLKTPDGKTLPMATQTEYGAADLRGIQMYADASRDSINYFPAGVTRPCRIGFFSDLDKKTLSFDKVELNSLNGCLGRIYFKVPGGIQVGQHWLVVQFAESIVEVPFRILTKEEEKEFRKTWEDIKKEHEESLK